MYVNSIHVSLAIFVRLCDICDRAVIRHKIVASAPSMSHLEHGSRVAQWKRAGPITHRSVDRNHALLTVLLQNSFATSAVLVIH